jgi:parallel beta-helix repeat protein
MRRKLVFVLSLFLFLFSLLYVRFNSVKVRAPNGTGLVHNLNTGYNYATIQEAIDANETLDGHTIFVENGTYFEHIVVNKSLTLRGESRDNTIIDGNGTGTVVWLSASSNITGFTIRNGEYGIQVRIFVFATPVFTGHRIEDNRIVDNRYGGVSLRGCANNTISNNIILNNTLFGIHLWTAGSNTMINNTVVNNGHGIDFYGNSNDNILRNNNMTDNEYNFGLILREETRNFLSGTPSKPGIVNDVDPSNTVNGKPIYYIVNRSNEQVPSDAGYIWLNNCTNIKINGCNLSSNLQGVLLLFCNNASITGNNIANNVHGIYVGLYSNNNTLVGNTLENNLKGIYLDDFSKFTTMRNNSISGGDMNFGFSPDIGRHISDWSGLTNDIDTSNTVNGKPIIYWINQHDQTVPTNAGYVMLINSTNILIEDLNLSNNVQNIFLLGSNNTIIANNSVTHSIYGIDVNYYGWIDYEAGMYRRFCSFNTTVKGNIVLDNGVGIRIMSDNSTISNNTLYRNPLGILADTSNGTISRNVVFASDLNTTNPGPDLIIFYYPEWPWERSLELMQVEIGGIIVGGGYNVIYGNTVKDSCYGLVMQDMIRSMWGSGNLVFHNNFINNTPYQAIGAPRASNNYDNGYPSGGNYWSNYNGTDVYSGPLRNETGSDGIGDTAFIVFPDSQFGVLDHYPLMAQINIFDADTWNGVNCDISIISNSTISNFQLNKTQKTISFNVTGKTGLGFCRIIIPNVIVQEFWQGNYTVLINGQPVESRNWTDESNTYIYFTYQHSEHQVVIIPEFSPLLIMPLLMSTMLLAAIIRKRKQYCASSL